MGLTAGSTGMGAVDNGFFIHRQQPQDKVVALAGNPNVGKSTVFNELTGLRQHTGNWPGKTVSNAQGRHEHAGRGYILVDIPGTYSLMAHSAEEEVARDFICFGEPDCTVVVCDATCLERNMNLVLQTIEITPNTVVCVNLMDEAKKKKIHINLKQLAENLGVPVTGASARSRKGLLELMEQVAATAGGKKTTSPVRVRYNAAIEKAIALVEPMVAPRLLGRLNPRWVALKLIDYDETLAHALTDYLGFNLLEDEATSSAIAEARQSLAESGLAGDKLRDSIVSCIVLAAESVCGDAVTFENEGYNRRDRLLDRIFTSRFTGIPVMILLLALVFWLTITGANLPSQWLSGMLFRVQEYFEQFLVWLGAPVWLRGALVDGVYRVLAWVVSVMLPPMAIFFPLFTLLEDSGYLPRVAFNLDKSFKKCSACGKQALTMCMGFGCNAAGVIGARIIDSPRERLIAIITNNFVPCNGRFPQP